MGQQVARVGDTVVGTCRAHKSPRSYTAILTTGSGTVTADGQAVCRVGDIGVTDCGHTVQIVSGSSVAKANGIPVARVGDVVIVVEGGDGTIVSGSPTTKSN